MQTTGRGDHALAPGDSRATCGDRAANSPSLLRSSKTICFECLLLSLSLSLSLSPFLQIEETVVQVGVNGRNEVAAD